MFEDRRSDRWVVVLAAGKGTRLSELTRTRDGGSVPKQFCSLFGGRSLLGDALARAELLAARERIVVVVARDQEQWWRQEFDGARARVVVQPDDRGTAAGVMLAVRSILVESPNAQVTLLPSDHFVADESALAASLLVAQDCAVPHRPLLIGAPAEAADPEYGYIVPVRACAARKSVAEFVEKPPIALAERLIERGAVWNTMMMVCHGQRLMQLYEQRLPRMIAAFRWARPEESPSRTAELYRVLEAADFSRDLLAGSEPFLDMRTTAPCGWTDLGTPSRVRACARVFGARRTLAPAMRAPVVDLAAAAGA